MLAGLVAVVAVAVYLSRTYLGLAAVPGRRRRRPHPGSDRLSSFTESFVNVVDGATNAFKDLISYGFLNPLQSLLAESPWWLMAAVLVASPSCWAAGARRRSPWCARR